VLFRSLGRERRALLLPFGLGFFLAVPQSGEPFEKLVLQRLAAKLQLLGARPLLLLVFGKPLLELLVQRGAVLLQFAENVVLFRLDGQRPPAQLFFGRGPVLVDLQFRRTLAFGHGRALVVEVGLLLADP
jgi:hypothetical protein